MPYLPEVIPDEDKRSLLEKYHGGAADRIRPGDHFALAIVDMTNSFVSDEYPTGCSRTGIPCARSIKKLSTLCRERGVPVLYAITPLYYDEDEASHQTWEVQLGAWLDKLSLLTKAEYQNVKEANQIYGPIKPEAQDIIIRKTKPSAFFDTPLASILTALRIDTLIVTGMTTSGCVRATVVDAFSHNYRVLVPKECVADRSGISHEVSLFDMDMKYSDVVSIDDLMARLTKVRPLGKSQDRR